jgi:hypothetical protein
MDSGLASHPPLLRSPRTGATADADGIAAAAQASSLVFLFVLLQNKRDFFFCQVFATNRTRNEQA